MDISDEKFKKNILDTLSFFHVFQYPLTKLEIYKFLFGETRDDRECKISDIQKSIEQLKSENVIDEKNGFYSLNIKESNPQDKNFFISSEEIFKKRMQRARIAENKYKKALKIIQILKYIPSIKMIGICNSLAYNNADKKSDIDLFIISQKKHIWITRLLTISILKVLRCRPTPENSSDKICASFFISEEELNLKKIQFAFDNEGFDIYLIYWIATLMPIYNQADTYEKFIKENLWINNYLINWMPNITNNIRDLSKRKNLFLSFVFHALSFIITEKTAKKIQKSIMPQQLKLLANKNSQVIINDSMLKFHSTDRREEFFKKWQKIRKLCDLKTAY